MALSASLTRPAWSLRNRFGQVPLISFRYVSGASGPLVPLCTVDTCPAPTYACASTPEGLDIDQRLPLLNTKPPYDRHLVICTGRSDWTSRIEDDETPPNLAKGLKALTGLKGPLHDPENKVLVTNSNFPSKARGPEAVSGFLFPDYKFFPNIDVTEEGQARFVTDVLQSSKTSSFVGARARNVIVLICGHGGRDQRCGVIGPLLKMEFQRLLGNAGAISENAAMSKGTAEGRTERKTLWRYARADQRPYRVALVSHVGGHKWAGNVIIYFHPLHQDGLSPSSLAGKGIWYGRVEPKHVEGIVSETIKGGKVIKELFRGMMEPTAKSKANT